VGDSRIRTRVFPGPQNLALFVAEARGVFARHGVEADIRITVGSDEQRTALAEGTVEVIHSAVDNAVYMVEADGQDIVIVSGGSNGMNELVVRPEVRSYADLRGKTVVVDAAMTAYAFQLYTMLARHGLARGDYGVLPRGGATQRLQAMRESPDHAAAMLNPPWSFVAERDGFRSFGPATGALGRYQADGAFVRRAWAAEHGETLVRYLRAGIEGLRWASAPANRGEAAAILARRLGIEPAIAARSVEAAVGPGGGLAPDAAFDTDGFENMLAIRDAVAGTWGGKIPDPRKYLDLTYYQRALAGLPRREA
jgi:ABC-type nitrate/sulfonate/bicarbonate transport system substrate-binding protein